MDRENISQSTSTEQTEIIFVKYGDQNQAITTVNFYKPLQSKYSKFPRIQSDMKRFLISNFQTLRLVQRSNFPLSDLY